MYFITYTCSWLPVVMCCTTYSMWLMSEDVTFCVTLFRLFDNSRKAFIFCLWTSFIHPDSVLPDGWLVPRKKNISGWIIGVARIIDWDISTTPPLDPQRSHGYLNRPLMKSKVRSAPNFQSLNCYNSAVDWLISLKFCMRVHYQSA